MEIIRYILYICKPTQLLLKIQYFSIIWIDMNINIYIILPLLNIRVHSTSYTLWYGGNIYNKISRKINISYRPKEKKVFFFTIYIVVAVDNIIIFISA